MATKISDRGCDLEISGQGQIYLKYVYRPESFIV